MGKRGSKTGQRKPPKGTKPLAGGTAPGAEIRVPFEGWRSSLLLMLASVALLSGAFPPLRWAWQAHFALVPMLVAIVRTPSRRVLLLAATVSGVVLYGCQMHWMTMISWPSWAGVVFYCLIFWLLFAVLVKWITSRLALPLVLVAPIVWVALEWCRSWVATGFPWLYLGHAQATNLTLLQMADLTGAYGPGALSAATAGMLADAMTRPLFLRYGTQVRLARSFRTSAQVLVVLWIAAIAYGIVQLNAGETTDGPLVVTIQTNVRQELKWHTPESSGQEAGEASSDSGSAGDGEPVTVPPEPVSLDELTEPEFILPKDDPSYDQAMQLTDEAARQWPEADLFIWPETAVVDYLNSESLDFPVPTLKKVIAIPENREFFKTNPRKAALSLARSRAVHARARRRWSAIRDLARRTGPILVGAQGLTVDKRRDMFNSAYLLTGDPSETLSHRGRQTYGNSGAYHKMHLVPFGEYVPFRDSAPWLYDFLMSFTPYTEDYNLTPGAESVPMPAGGAAFVTAICFEDAFADVCRQMVYPGGKKSADFLVNISNDGWFYGTVELEQHWDLSVFRAVENRVPVVRSVNTGISGFIDSCGRTVSRVSDGAGHVRSVVGTGAERLPLDSRSSFYGLYGDAFAMLLSLGAAGLIIMSLLGPRQQGNGGTPQAEGKAK